MSPALDRIKKLLRLSRCSAATPAEAANAMAKAISLAAEHGIDLNKVSTEEDFAAALTHRTEPSQRGIPHRLASRLVRRHFGVDALFDKVEGKPVIHFVGLPENCDLAIYCYVFLVRTLRAAWRNRKNRRLRDRDAFLRGFAAVIDDKMPEVFHRPGLILSTERYMEEVLLGDGGSIKLFGRRRKPLASTAALEGVIAAQDASIHNAIRGTDKPLID
ncbi:MAG: DUF2786 domain-containing protein [Verrucomicrobiota bacterium]